MARTKVFYQRSFLSILDRLFIPSLSFSKPPASPLEVGNPDKEITLKVNFDLSFLGKAPRKQLATKAARKTAAAVRTGFNALVVVVVVITC
jgi:hypothetical protein